MGPQAQGWIMDILRQIFGFLDSIVYGLIKWILYGIFDLTHLTTNSNVFSGIGARIYVVLGIFMAFKLSFSFIQYIIDPESMTGKSEKGVGKLFMRVFVMLIALMALPSLLFGSGSNNSNNPGLLARAQNAFLPVLPRLILGVDKFEGTDPNTGEVSQTIEESAEQLSVIALKGFFSPPQELDDICGAGKLKSNPEISSLQDFQDKLTQACHKTWGNKNWSASKYYTYSYLPFVSTVVGVLIVLMLLGITLDVAKRIFKLLILEVVAPIPIMSLIDPKGAKDGAFSHWVKSLTTTFVDIFIKIGLVYIVLVLIQMIVDSSNDGGLFSNFPSFEETPFRATYLTVCLVLGLIFFAKEAPKFIKDALGMKDSGGGLFDDVKTLGKAAGFVGGAAAVVGGVAAGGISGVAGGISATYNSAKEGNLGRFNNRGGRIATGIAQGAAHVLGGAISGAVRGGVAGGKNAKKGNVLKGLSSAVGAQSVANATKNANAAAGSTVLGRTGARLSRMVTGQTAADRDETRIGAYKNAIESAKNFKSVLADSAGKSAFTTTINGKSGVNLRGFKATLAAANANDAAAKAALTSVYGYTDLTAANNASSDFEKEYMKTYYSAISTGAYSDDGAAAVFSAKAVADQDMKGLELEDKHGTAITEINGGNIGAITGSATSHINSIKTNKKYGARKRSSEATKKGK